MTIQRRIYNSILAEHLASQRQMAFVSGPRQVGKTTSCQQHADFYLNWDNSDDRLLILAGEQALAEHCKLDRLRESKATVLFDELHKYPKWKQFLKGFYDKYGKQINIMVTGSSRMDVYRRGGDSLMGRYFLYRMHPFSIAEVLEQTPPSEKHLVQTPQPIHAGEFEALWEYGGYPEPFLKRDRRFSRRWQQLRLEQLLREDIRDVTQIQQLAQLEVLARLLLERSSQQLIYGNLAKEVRVSTDTVRRWVDVLRNLHLGFVIRPWFKNVSRALRKEPKWYLSDWSLVSDAGARAETFVACHLLKAVDAWNDMGLGKFALHYLRDKEKNEVDFLIVNEGMPWMLVEIKLTDEVVSPALRRYFEALQADYAFQVVFNADYVDMDCFSEKHVLKVVPARTFLSQLV